jgi:hypothetical protein
MLKQFYEKALPTQGVYCATGIDPTTQGRVQNKFGETLDEVLKLAEGFNKKNWNSYIALGSFEGFSRRAEDCIYFRSFFVDLDVDEAKAAVGKGYISKEAALEALAKFLEEQDLPPPIRIDSGTGVHAYWLLEEDVPIDEYLPYAEKFKEFVLKHLHADPAVMADAARIMRYAASSNYKTIPPSPTGFIDTEFPQYSFEAFKEFLGPVESKVNLMDLLPKGLDEETKAMLKLDNFETTFQRIVERTFEGDGCAQIKYAIENEEHLEEPMWHSVLTIAAACSDGRESAHKISSGYKGYSATETDKKFDQIIEIFEKDGGPHLCSTFENRNPGVCDGCPHKGKLKSPVQLGKSLLSRPKEEHQEESVREEKSTQAFPDLPGLLAPFVRGINGGIYYQPPTKYGKDGKAEHQDALLISQYDFYPVRRMYSPYDGECFVIRLILPNDSPREFLLPMKQVYAQEEFKKIMSSNGVFFNPNYVKLLAEYIVKWGQYLVNTGRAEVMRRQMGWTDDNETFVIGGMEVNKDTGATGRSAPTSPLASNVAKALKEKGSLELWKEGVNKLNQPSLEMHAFAVMASFGSPLMEFRDTNGVSISYQGKSGVGKSGALYAALSIWGDPKKMSVFEATDNAMNDRIVTSKNIFAGIDEAGDKDGKVVAAYIHKISQGNAKLRLNGNTMAERIQELRASLIAMLTTNHSLLNKVKAIKGSPYGEAARLVEFYIHKPQAFIEDPAKGPEIFGTFNRNYGLAGPIYAYELINRGEAELRTLTDKWIARFREDFGHLVEYRYYEDLIGCSFGGAEIACQIGLIDFDIERIYRKVISEIINIRDGVIRINDVDFESILGEFINANIGGTLSILNDKVISQPSPNKHLYVRADFDEEKVYISTTAFDKYLAENNISEKEFVFAMKNKGIFLERKRHRLATGWRGAASEYNVRAYVFKYAAPEELKQQVEHVDE